MRGNTFEILTGFAVVVLSAALLVYAYMGTQGKNVSGYQLRVKFERADGLHEGSDVKIGGIRVGQVVRLELDPVNYSAVAVLSIDPNVKLPTDTSAAIISENLLGGKYLSVTPGGDEEMLKPGDQIESAQSSVILEDLIGRFIFSDKEDKKESKHDDQKSGSSSNGSSAKAA